MISIKTKMILANVYMVFFRLLPVLLFAATVAVGYSINNHWIKSRFILAHEYEIYYVSFVAIFVTSLFAMTVDGCSSRWFKKRIICKMEKKLDCPNCEYCYTRCYRNKNGRGREVGTTVTSWHCSVLEDFENETSSAQ